MPMSNRTPRRLSRRALIAVGGGAVAVMGAAAYAVSRGALGPIDNSQFAPKSYSFEDSAACVLTARMTEGPYYIDEALIRRDIREDRQGVAFALRLKVVDAATCAALPGAAVDMWHCDAGGVYSAAPQFGRDERTSPGHLKPDGAARFLRGRQVAGADGFVEFVTIYPGWYSGRTPHIHLKVLVGEREAATSQLFFPTDLSNEIYAGAPYAARGPADTPNDRDGVLNRARGGDGAWPKITRASAGVIGTLTIGVARP